MITYLWALITSFLQSHCERWGIKIGPYDGAVYRGELIAQTDYRKYDGMLRTVLDVSPQQADALEAWLEEAYRAGRLIYGLHRDRRALMTCLVFSLEASEHVHFIDAAGGGLPRRRRGSRRGWRVALSAICIRPLPRPKSSREAAHEVTGRSARPPPGRALGDVPTRSNVRNHGTINWPGSSAVSAHPQSCAALFQRWVVAAQSRRCRLAKLHETPEPVEENALLRYAFSANDCSINAVQSFVP